VKVQLICIIKIQITCFTLGYPEAPQCPARSSP